MNWRSEGYDKRFNLIDVKKPLTPRIKILKTRSYEKVNNVKKRWIKKRCRQIEKSNQTKLNIPRQNYCLNAHDNVWGLRLLMWEFFTVAMLYLNPSLKSCFMQEFCRLSKILAGLDGYKISSLENKKRLKNKKNVKKRGFYKNNKKRKKTFCLHLWFIQHIFK